jgi:hypothetical protein
VDQDKKYGLPTLKKYPMPDADHVRSAIKFFNYVDSRHEKELAGEILARMKEYGISFTDLNVGDENRFKKYLPNNELKHHGILGMKWGVRRHQNPDGSLTDEERKRRRTKQLVTIGSGIALTALGIYGTMHMRDISNHLYKASVRSTLDDIDWANLGPEVVHK